MGEDAGRVHRLVSAAIWITAPARFTVTERKICMPSIYRTGMDNLRRRME
jgi:hypothetical protein